MYRGTTPTLFFKIKNIEDLTTIEDIWVTIRMKDKGQDKNFLNKTLLNNEVNIDFENKIVSINLTQKETLLFTAPEIKVQLKVLFKDEKVCVSPIFKVCIEGILNQQVMEVKKENSTPIEPDNPAKPEEVLPDDGLISI